MSFLAVDVGNTRLKWALYAAPVPGAVMVAHGAVFLEAIDQLAEGQWRDLPPPASMLGSIVAGEASAAAPKSSSRSGTSSRAGS